MKRSGFLFLIILFVLYFPVLAQTSAFTYQGKLTDLGQPANGPFDFTFRLFDAQAGGYQVGGDILVDDLQATAGIFTVVLDFGATAFISSSERYLEISVRRGTSAGAYTPLAPLQRITSSPSSIRSVSAGAADSMSAACVLCIADGHIASVDVGKITGVLSASQGGTGIGPALPPANTYLRSNGFGWTVSGLSASDIAGVVSITNGGTGSSTKNFLDLTTTQSADGNKTFTGSVTVSGAGGVFNGNGSGLTNLNGANISNNTINASALASDTFPNNRNLSQLGSLRWDQLHQAVPVGVVPLAAAFDGSNIWVANSNSNSVTKIKASDGSNLGEFPVVNFPNAIAFDGSNVWVTNYNNNSVRKLRASDGAQQGTFTVGGFPTGIAFDGSNVWVANSIPSNTNNVTKLRASDGANVGTFSISGESRSLVFDGEYVWVTTAGPHEVKKLRASDGGLVATYPLTFEPNLLAFDGSNIWLTSYFGNTVTKLKASDGTPLGTFTVGSGPQGIVFDGENIWIANNTGKSVTKLRPGDGTTLGTFEVGAGPRVMAFDGASIWVVNSASNTVTKLPVF